MRIAITGGGGFLGRRLAKTLLGEKAVESILLADIAPIRPFSSDTRLQVLLADLSDEASAAEIARDADVIFHLAAVVSGQAEANFDIGMRVNLNGTRCLLEAARSAGRAPRFVFTSSLAVFGPPLPAVVTDETAVHPQSSYGAQKAVGELLVTDYSRKGFIDGRVVRLPTVCVRPGLPNAAASSFVSGIIREPLHGQAAVCPVGTDLELWLCSPVAAVGNLAHAASLAPEALGSRRIVNVPGITVTVGEMISSLRKAAGEEAAARIAFKADPVVKRIVSSWPARFDVGRALALGFRQDSGFDFLVSSFQQDEALEKGR
jgi:nucleoside-diphosphate-sugar epimerase